MVKLTTWCLVPDTVYIDVRMQRGVIFQASVVVFVVLTSVNVTNPLITYVLLLNDNERNSGQVKASNRYTLEHFDQDLRAVMWRVGVQGERVCFIFDESNVLSPAFLERYTPATCYWSGHIRLMLFCTHSIPSVNFRLDHSAIGIVPLFSCFDSAVDHANVQW